MKRQIELRSSSILPSERVLLNSFRYYDMYNSGEADKNMFFKVLKLKLGFNMFDDDFLGAIYKYYVNRIGGDEKKGFNYRIFISNLLHVTNVIPKSYLNSKSKV